MSLTNPDYETSSMTIESSNISSPTQNALTNQMIETLSKNKNEPYRRNPAEIDAFFKKLKAARITIAGRFFQDESLQRTRCRHCEIRGIDNTWSWHVSSEAMKGHLYWGGFG